MFLLRTSLPLYSIFRTPHNSNINNIRLFPVKILPKLLIADRHVHFHSSRRLVLTSYTQAPSSTTATTNPPTTPVIYYNTYKMSSSEDDMPLAKTNGHSKFPLLHCLLTQLRLEEFHVFESDFFGDNDVTSLHIFSAPFI